ncbi:septum site-determining protein MinC [Alteribacillus sp. HJP-4]|uniref:septum site-determining protein MinC n=1 Tax=Alteribacillus sp. HJP-4 TaxID=2775394 RepID=UPI0035CD0CAD
MNAGSAKNLVTIKGTKDGLTILLDDECSFELLTKELKEKITRDKKVFENGPEVEVKVDAGYRYLSEERRKDIHRLLEETGTIRIGELISHVISKEQAKKLQEETGLTSFTKIVRSGQVLKANGDVLLLGDVNPGGTVEATGNIYIMGTLSGTARAGIEGRTNAVVCASVMSPNQISIHDRIYYAPDRYEKTVNGPLFKEPVFAYIAPETQESEILFEKTRMLNQFQSTDSTSEESI